MNTVNKIKYYRLKHAWSQEQLAEMTALSVRTIQRVENGEKPSLETLSALAAVFQVSVYDLSIASVDDNVDETVTHKVREAEQRVEQESRFYTSLISYVVVCSLLALINYIFTPKVVWAIFPIISWGAVILFAWLRIFILKDAVARWKQKRIQQMLRK
ncbi:2TM domain-containing protein [Acinetobacter rathckeae]|uniref:2TM domain-containing protein n=1 Tax=Acinetobacter rathckeae TaxID=2605272 RepID=UPI0018A2EFCE|nr:2TM domain-containing protein [Acinetobacter rathckeae]MBF7687785.1 2TM domain-containing protein [Acinetobacter rathckeae]MBF7687992.1 2TM domain-containing protein [Acinetobacter rathckeae]MBF7695954.1 2TM domain-containing protein [Acinetobacter rathckeae]